MSKHIVSKSIEQYKQRVERQRQYYALQLKANLEQHKLRVEKRRQYILKKLKANVENHKQQLESQPCQLKHIANENVKECDQHLENQQQYNAKHRDNESVEHKQHVKDQQMKGYVGAAVKSAIQYQQHVNKLQQCGAKETIPCEMVEDTKQKESGKEIKTKQNNDIFHATASENFQYPKPNVNGNGDAVHEFDSLNEDSVPLDHEYEVKGVLKMEIDIEPESIQQSKVNEKKELMIDIHERKQIITDLKVKPLKSQIRVNITDATNIETSNDDLEKGIHIKIEPLDDET